MICTSEFSPAWWLRNTHAQTIWPSLFRRPVEIELEWERIELPDNDFIDLAWTGENTDTIVIVLHGLEGSINSHYIKGMLTALSNKGWRSVLMHFRGCSGEHNRQIRSYHSGETGDVCYFINQLRTKFPHKKLAAVGFSLGGNVLLKYLGESGKHSHLTAAVAVSVPLELEKGAKRLNKGISKIYQQYLIRRLQKKTVEKFKTRNDVPFKVENITGWNSFYTFDNFVTAPLHGFNNCMEYYRKCSSRQFLKKIMTPTLIIHAKDDPFLTTDAIPTASELSDQVILELSEQGGHVGFISGRWPGWPDYWLENRIPGFLQQYIC